MRYCEYARGCVSVREAVVEPRVAVDFIDSGQKRWRVRLENRRRPVGGDSRTVVASSASEVVLCRMLAVVWTTFRADRVVGASCGRRVDSARCGRHSQSVTRFFHL